MTNNQTKWGIIYEKIAMREGDDERMINYEWPNGVKYFASGIFQNYLVFIPTKKYINILVVLLGFNRGNLLGC